MAYFDPAEQITATIVAAIESGETGKDWVLPWHKSQFAIPINASTKAEYKGINILAFMWAAQCRNYRTNFWATYKQWETLGAKVRRGEKATLGMYYERKVQENPDTGEESSYMFAKGFMVFNADQVDGWIQPEPVKNDIARNVVADKIVSNTNAAIKYGFDRACYIPALDIINMPDDHQFNSPDGFYSTLFHEICHWTGHKSRLDRKLNSRLDYAFEELVADLGAAFVCASLGLHSELPADHIKYVALWATKMRADKRILYKAASLAQKARDYILNPS